MEESDFEAVPLKTVRAIEIEQFVDADREEYGATFVKQAYYLEPDAVGRKAFYLLKSVLKESQLQAICKIVLKDREMLAALDPYSTTMLLSTLYWPDEVRDLGELELPEAEFQFKPAEVQMAQQLVQAMTGDFDASQYRDEYRQALLSVIEAKVEGQPVEAPKAMEEPSRLTDLMAVLEASVAAARQTRDGAAKASDEASERAAGGRARGRRTADEPTSVAEARKARAAKPAPKAATKPAARSGSRAATRAAADEAKTPARAASGSAGAGRKRKTA